MIKFGGVDRIYDAYSWRITRKAKEVWRSGNVISSRHLKDTFLDKFETSVAKYTKRKFAIAVGSGTDALYFALRAKGIGPESTVLCPAISYLATAEAIKRTGATIQFVDVDNKGLISKLPDFGLPNALVYVNLFGNLAQYERLKEYCSKRSIPFWSTSLPTIPIRYLSGFTSSPILSCRTLLLIALPEILSTLNLAGNELSVAGFHSSRSTPFNIPRSFPEI